MSSTRKIDTSGLTYYKWRVVASNYEENDETNLTGELACAGGACEVK